MLMTESRLLFGNSRGGSGEDEGERIRAVRIFWK